MKLTQHTKTVEIAGGSGETRYELHHKDLYCSIKIFRTWKGDWPEVHTGSKQYIKKLWKEMTGKVAPL